MGLYHSVFIGPGFELEPIVEKEKVMRKGCGNNHPVRGNYCSECGNKYQDVEIEEEYHVSVYDLIGSDRLTPSNMKDGPPIYSSNFLGFGQEIEAESAKVLNSQEIQTMIDDFKSEHDEDIAKIENRIGKKVEVKFYVIHDYS